MAEKSVLFWYNGKNIGTAPPQLATMEVPGHACLTADFGLEMWECCSYRGSLGMRLGVRTATDQMHVEVLIRHSIQFQ